MTPAGSCSPLEINFQTMLLCTERKEIRREKKEKSSNNGNGKTNKMLRHFQNGLRSGLLGDFLQKCPFLFLKEKNRKERLFLCVFHQNRLCSSFCFFFFFFFRICPDGMGFYYIYIYTFPCRGVKSTRPQSPTFLMCNAPPVSIYTNAAFRCLFIYFLQFEGEVEWRMKLSDSSDRRGVRGEVASALETSAVAPATVPHFTRLCDLVNSSSIFVIVAHRSCFFFICLFRQAGSG